MTLIMNILLIGNYEESDEKNPVLLHICNKPKGEIYLGVCEKCIKQEKE